MNTTSNVPGALLLATMLAACTVDGVPEAPATAADELVSDYTASIAVDSQSSGSPTSCGARDAAGNVYVLGRLGRRASWGTHVVVPRDHEEQGVVASSGPNGAPRWMTAVNVDPVTHPDCMLAASKAGEVFAVGKRGGTLVVERLSTDGFAFGDFAIGSTSAITFDDARRELVLAGTDASGAFIERRSATGVLLERQRPRFGTILPADAGIDRAFVAPDGALAIVGHRGRWAAYDDAFVARVERDGSVRDFKQLGPEPSTRHVNASIDASGNLFLLGVHLNPLVGVEKTITDLTGATVTMPSPTADVSSYYADVLALDAHDGDLWHRGFPVGSADPDRILGDDAGGAYLAGGAWGPVSFGALQRTKDASARQALFLARLGADGAPRNLELIGSSRNGFWVVGGLFHGAPGELVVTGEIPTGGTITGAPVGGRDVFIAARHTAQLLP